MVECIMDSYLLEEEVAQHNSVVQTNWELAQKEIYLWHLSLEHPAFKIIEKTFPNLFQWCNPELLRVMLVNLQRIHVLVFQWMIIKVMFLFTLCILMCGFLLGYLRRLDINGLFLSLIAIAKQLGCIWCTLKMKYSLVLNDFTKWMKNNIRPRSKFQDLTVKRSTLRCALEIFKWPWNLTSN